MYGTLILDINIGCGHKYGYYFSTCGGFVVAHHNHLWDCFTDFCQKVGLAPELEKGCNFGCKDHICPADVFVPNWSLSRPA